MRAELSTLLPVMKNEAVVHFRKIRHAFADGNQMLRSMLVPSVLCSGRTQKFRDSADGLLGFTGACIRHRQAFRVRIERANFGEKSGFFGGQNAFYT